MGEHVKVVEVVINNKNALRMLSPKPADHAENEIADTRRLRSHIAILKEIKKNQHFFAVL